MKWKMKKKRKKRKPLVLKQTGNQTWNSHSQIFFFFTLIRLSIFIFFFTLFIKISFFFVSATVSRHLKCFSFLLTFFSMMTMMMMSESFPRIESNEIVMEFSLAKQKKKKFCMKKFSNKTRTLNYFIDVIMLLLLLMIN